MIMKTINVPVLVLEDRVIQQYVDFTNMLSMPHHEIVDRRMDLVFSWHSEWNHLGGSHAKKAQLGTRLIANKAVHAEAIEFCQTACLSESVVFVDLQLKYEDRVLTTLSCNIPEEFWRFYEYIDPDIANHLGGTVDNQRRHVSLAGNNNDGLLLAFLMLRNPKITNVDIWIASDVSLTDRCALLLQNVAEVEGRGVRVFDARGSCSRFTSEGPQNLVERFRAAFKTFAGRYSAIEYRLWPDYAQAWFHDGDSEAPKHLPHHYEHVADQAKADYRADIGKYLFELTGREDIPSVWFSDEALHESLKRLVGGNTVAQVGNGHNVSLKLPSLGAIPLLAAAAEKSRGCVPAKGEDWLRKFAFCRSALAPILPSEANRAQVREAIVSLHDFFVKLLPPAPTEDEARGTTIRAAGWVNRNGLDYFFLDFGINCLLPDEGKTDALLDKLTNMRWWEAGGSTTSAYRSFRDKFALSGRCKLSVSICPLAVDEGIPTRFLFRPL